MRAETEFPFWIYHPHVCVVVYKKLVALVRITKVRQCCSITTLYLFWCACVQHHNTDVNLIPSLSSPPDTTAAVTQTFMQLEPPNYRFVPWWKPSSFNSIKENSLSKSLNREENFRHISINWEMRVFYLVAMHLMMVCLKFVSYCFQWSPRLLN